MTAWYEELGYTAHPAADAPASLISDEMRLGGVIVRRVWHTAMRVQATDALTFHQRATRITKTILHVDGTALMEFDDLSFTARPHDLVCFAGHRLRSQASSMAVARIEIETKGVPLGSATTRVLSNASTPTPVTAILAGTVNALLNTDAPVAPHVATWLARSIDLLVLAARDEPRPATDDERRPPTPSGDALYRRAMQFLRDNAHDPAVTVGSLAATMGVSRQHLSRSFAAHGTTPIAGIRARRLERADVLRSAGVSCEEELARGAGFSSVWALRRALQAAERTDARE